MPTQSFKQYLIEQSNNMMLETSQLKDYSYPGGVYIAVLPDEESNAQIKEFQENEVLKLGITDLNSELHSTIIYSAKPHKQNVQTSPDVHVAQCLGYELFGDESNILVMKLSCPSLSKRFDDLTDQYGFVSDYDEYRPHITLAYDVKDVDISKLPLYNKTIILKNEYSEGLDVDWEPSE